jgi:hypothetical protein
VDLTAEADLRGFQARKFAKTAESAYLSFGHSLLVERSSALLYNATLTPTFSAPGEELSMWLSPHQQRDENQPQRANFRHSQLATRYFQGSQDGSSV